MTGFNDDDDDDYYNDDDDKIALAVGVYCSHIQPWPSRHRLCSDEYEQTSRQDEALSRRTNTSAGGLMAVM